MDCVDTNKARTLEPLRPVFTGLAYVGLVMFVGAAAQGPVPAANLHHGNGTEVLVTDTGGKVILGFGTVEADRLELSVNNSSQNVAMLLLDVSGRTTVLEGVISDEAIALEETAAPYDYLRDYLAASDIALELVFIGDDVPGTPEYWAGQPTPGESPQRPGVGSGKPEDTPGKDNRPPEPGASGDNPSGNRPANPRSDN